MEDLGEKKENLRGEMEDYITSQNQEDAKMKIDNIKLEDMDGLQMLRLPQEEDKSLLKKDVSQVLSIEFKDQSTLFENPHDDIKCFEVPKSIIQEDDSVLEKANVDIMLEKESKSNEDLKPSIEEEMSTRKIALKHEGVEGNLVKPALVKKEVGEIQDRLTERQQKILQDFHVKFVLEGVSEEENVESRAKKHFEFVELKRRLEEEEKIYAGCALGEASNITNESDTKYDMEKKIMVSDSYDSCKDMNQSTTTMAKNIMAPVNDTNEDNTDSSISEMRATIDGVINSLAGASICSLNDSSMEENMKSPLGPPNINNAMNNLTYDDKGFLELQEYTNREGSIGCECYCQKAEKQKDKGDENDVYMTHSSYSVLNVVCPISGIPVVDLEDPIRSEECEHVYDRSSVLNFMSRMANNGFCLCQSPGCQALLIENKLVTDTRLWQDIEELRQIKATMWESHMLQDLINIDESDDD